MVVESIASVVNTNIFFQIGIIIVVASIFSFIAKRLKQPLIVGYIFAGLLLRPVFTNILGISMENINVLAEIGIAFMLFIVGLELDFRKLRSVRNVAVFGGLISTFLVFCGALALSLLLGFNLNQAIYLGVIFSFSSTMIILKLLYDKNELDTVHGRIIVGFLLIQDVIAIVLTPLLSQLENLALIGIAINLLKVGLFLGIVFVISRYVLKPVFRRAASNQELLVLTAVSTSFFFSLIAINIGNFLLIGANLLGFSSPALTAWAQSGISLAIGAFMGGVAIANLPYSFEIVSKINPLKDFFGTIFFVSLGLELSFSQLRGMFFPMLVMILFTILFKPLITFIITGLFGYGKKISFQVSNPMTQVSEFGLIIAMQGLTLGILTREAYSVVIGSTMFGAAITPYFMDNSSSIYRRTKKLFGFMDKISAKGMEHIHSKPDNLTPEVILCGCNRTGYPVLKKIVDMKKSIVVIDYNPNVIEKLSNEGIPTIYGDATDPEILDTMSFDNLELFISTSQDIEDNLFLLKQVRERNKKAIIFLSASDVDEALVLYDKGCDYVIIPHFLGGIHASLLVEKFNQNIENLVEHKQQHLRELMERKKIGKHHPINK